MANNGSGHQALNTRQTTSVRGDDGNYTLACEISELGWARIPQTLTVTSHKTGDEREFMLLREVKCEASGDLQLWIFKSPTQPNTTIQIYND